MSLETDLLLDRRRLQRRLWFWRGFAIIAVVACALLLVGRSGVVVGAHVARLNVTGIITDNRKLTEAVTHLATDRNVKALVVYVDSPGGSVAGGESLHDAIAQVAAKKPVVTVMGGTAASAGYMVSVPAARIFARASTLTGSIGVLLETGEVSGLLSKIGVTADAITSGPLKDQPSFTRPLTPEGREVLHGLVMDMYDQFVGMVADGRHMPPDKVRALADGRAYTGRQALQLGLVDQLGDEQQARDWLAANRGVPASLPVVDVRLGGLAQRAFGSALSGVADGFMKTVLLQGLTLDGAWALWQPSQTSE
jgi:protease IV